MLIFTCQFCSRETTNPGANKKHEIGCSKNPNAQKCGGNKRGYVPWNTGKKLHYEVGTKNKPGTFRGRTHTKETKQKMSESKKQLYASGWECKAGRCPKYEHHSPIAGKIKVDGSWELTFCKFADKNNLKWSRNKKRFYYTKPDGSSSTYQPDFFVEDWDCFVEIKGYETDLDRCKWSQFSQNLRVLRKREIGEMDEWLKSTPC